MSKFYRDGFENVHLYISPEMDHTNANGMKTLYVTGVRSVQQTIDAALNNNCKNVHFGALGTFQKNKKLTEIIDLCFEHGLMVTVEYPLSVHDWVQENFSQYFSNRNFIPIINVTIDNIEDISLNTVVKFDDTTWNSTNRGTWSVTVPELLSSNRFVDWVNHNNEEIVWTTQDQEKMTNEKRNYVYGKKKDIYKQVDEGENE